MLLFILAYLGGVLTILSPCILPVLPFVFARADRPFVESGLPMLAGMAATFALVATLAAVGGNWAVTANEYGRFAALALVALFGVALIFPSVSERLTRPVVALGDRLSQNALAGEGRSSILPSLLLGVATGLLWAPCAGPILGLILTGAAIQGASIGTTVLLLAYAAGAATSLALALLVGGRVFAVMKSSLGFGEWVRRGLGVAVLGAVAAIAFGFDTGVLTRVSAATTASLEQKLLDMLHTREAAPMTIAMAGQPIAGTSTLPVEGTLPALTGATTWLNSPPLTPEALKGKVVLVDFWTYSCINCLRAIPYVRAWAEKYKDKGLVVVGVHAPEFAFEKQVDNVKKAVADLKIGYPVAIDNDYAIWRAFGNQYWPAHYFIDAEGRIRHHHFGEGSYEESEQIIKELLAEAGKSTERADLVKVTASGAEAASAKADVRSPETYIGYARAVNFISPGGAVKNAAHDYAPGNAPRLNDWALAGDWTVGPEHAALNKQDGSIVYRFHARDLHLVLGPSTDGRPVRFRVTVDGAAPSDSHGTDVDAQGRGVVTDQRLYQLVRQSGPIADRTFAIEFLDPGVQAYAFTFG
jgi:cytochrome c biogenesis protein CcdA/thiol-disulfide isomerase/thioredoxin